MVLVVILKQQHAASTFNSKSAFTKKKCNKANVPYVCLMTYNSKNY